MRCFTCHVRVRLEAGEGGLRAKAAPRVVIEIEEVLAPHFDKGITVLDSITRVNGVHLWRQVVAVSRTVIGIGEVSDQGH